MQVIMKCEEASKMGSFYIGLDPGVKAGNLTSMSVISMDAYGSIALAEEHLLELPIYEILRLVRNAMFRLPTSGLLIDSGDRGGQILEMLDVDAPGFGCVPVTKSRLNNIEKVVAQYERLGVFPRCNSSREEKERIVSRGLALKSAGLFNWGK